MSWSHSVGESPFKVDAYEHPRRKGMLYLRWRVDRPGTGRNWKLESLRKTLRTAEGKIIRERERWAKAMAEAKHYELVRGLEAEARPTTRLTIGETATLITDPRTGAFPKETPHRKEVLRALAFASDVWGSRFAWADLRRRNWRQLARVRLAQLQAEGHAGLRGAEIVVARVLTVLKWLVDEELVPDGVRLPPERWQKELRTEAGAQEPHRPRYTVGELRRILDAASAIDPRFGLLTALAAEYRMGQAARSTRSDLDLTAGTFRIWGKGKKLGAVVKLTPDQLAAARHALEQGYLTELEGTRADFPLFPSGKLSRRKDGGIAVLAHAERKPVHGRTIGAWWEAAEALAGIDKLAGRGYYGARRTAVDFMKRRGVSREALQESGGWSDTQVADQVYAERDREWARNEAAGARAELRGEGENRVPTAKRVNNA